jgi:hypothetical protein
MLSALLSFGFDGSDRVLQGLAARRGHQAGSATVVLHPEADEPASKIS